VAERTRRLGPVGLAWRSVVLVVGAAAVTAGSVVGDDGHWPFGPMSQYAFSVPDDGAVSSRYVMADTVDGTTQRVPLTSGGVGVRRAEIEGQLPRIQHDPSMLQDLAVAAYRMHPDWPRYARLRVEEQVTRLRGGRVAGTEHRVLASWTVPDPERPRPVVR
jgi:hypothetical protein